MERPPPKSDLVVVVVGERSLAVGDRGSSRHKQEGVSGSKETRVVGERSLAVGDRGSSRHKQGGVSGSKETRVGGCVHTPGCFLYSESKGLSGDAEVRRVPPPPSGHRGPDTTAPTDSAGPRGRGWGLGYPFFRGPFVATRLKVVKVPIFGFKGIPS